MTSSEYTLGDYRQRPHARKVPAPLAIKKIRKEFGKPAFRLLSELVPLSRGPGKITLADYVLYRLFDDALYDDRARARFISDRQHWPLVTRLGDMKWWGTTEDKSFLYSLLDHHGVPIPQTLAVIDQGSRDHGQAPVAKTADELRSMLNGAEFPVFFKPVMGVGSYGAMLVHGISDGEVELEGREPLPLWAFFDELAGMGAYLVQPYVRNHPDVAALSAHLATVRCYNFRDGDDLAVRWTLLKLVGGDNIADNYWRDGNMLADVDPDTGRLKRVITGEGFALRTIDSHPVSGQPFADVSLPYWADVLALNERCANIYSPIRYSNTDIAITPDGPVVVEVNIGGAFTLPQLATGQGMLTDEVAAFFGISPRR